MSVPSCSKLGDVKNRPLSSGLRLSLAALLTGSDMVFLADGSGVRTDPTNYPGIDIPDSSFLMNWSCYVRFVVPNGRRVGQANILWDGELSDYLRRASGCRKLNSLLVQLGEAGINDRIPVLAYGSNASPTQLRNKFSEANASSKLIPLCRAKVRNVDAVFSAHLTSYCALAATLVPSRNTVLSAFVAFLTHDQLSILDRTEPNYNRVVIDASISTELESGETISQLQTYVSKHGVLTFADGSPRRLADIEAESPAYKRLVEEQALLDMLEMWNDSNPRLSIDTIGELVARVRDGELITERVTDWLKETHGEPLTGSLGVETATVNKRHTYGATVTTWSDIGNNGPFLVRMNSTDERPPGDYSAVVNSSDISRSRVDKYAVVSAKHEGRTFSITAAIIRNDDVDDGCVHLDQTVRNAIGVDVGERVAIEPIRGGRAYPLSLLRRRYVVMRTQSADLMTLEKSACAMSRWALDLLGVAHGDQVVIENEVMEDGSYRLVPVRLRAYELPDDAFEQRRRLQSASLATRFPDCSEALGVKPDLPWIFIDAGARRRLDLQKCDAIRVRPSRRFKLLKESRELGFVVVLALIGAVSVADSTRFALLILSVGIGFLVLLSLLTLRSRIRPYR